MEREARGVLREHARLDRPDPAGVGAREQGLHERAADASAASALARRRPSSRRRRRSTLATTSARGRPSRRRGRPRRRRSRCSASGGSHRTRRSREAPSRTSLRGRDALGVDRLDGGPVVARHRPDLDHHVQTRLAAWSGGRRSTATERSSTGTPGSTASSRSCSASSTRTGCSSATTSSSRDPGGAPRRVLPRGAHDRARGARGRDGPHASRGRGERARALAPGLAGVRGRARRAERGARARLEARRSSRTPTEI